MLGVEHGEEGVDVRVENGLADEAERAVPDPHGFGEALGADARDAAHHFDFRVVACFHAFEDEIWGIYFPAPCGSDGIRAVTPAEDAFIAAAERGGGFHAEVGVDAVEAVFVAGSAAS